MPSIADLIADLIAGGLLSVGFVLLIALAELWRISRSPPAEYTRKLVHCGGGMVALAMPFCIGSHWVVLGMAGAMAGVFLLSRHWGLLPSLHAVERTTRGIEYYPVAIYGLYLMSHSQPWKYVICLLVLAVGDALAALVGKRFGRVRYEVDGNHKSLEGSTVFFLVTLLVVAVPLLVWPDPTIPSAMHCLLAAVLTAALATGFELIALDGRDNLWLPLGVCIVLTKLLRQPLDELVLQNIAFAVIAGGVAVSAYYSRAFNVGATFVFLLATYGTWSLGSRDWAWPAAAGLALYLTARAVGRTTITVRSRRITRRLMVPFLLLFAANVAWQYDRLDWYVWFFGPFVVGCLAAAVVGMGIALTGRHAAEPVRRRREMLLVSLVSAAVLVAPCLLLQRGVSPLAAIVAGLIGVTVGQVFAWGAPVDEHVAEHQSGWTHWLAATGVGAAAVGQAVGISPLWNPQ